MELGWGGFDRAKLDMLILIWIPFSFHVISLSLCRYSQNDDCEEVSGTVARACCCVYTCHVLTSSL